MSNNENGSLPVVTKEIAAAQIRTDLSKAGMQYQKVLDEATAITFSKDNLDADYEPLKKLGLGIKKLKEQENPYTAAWQAWNQARGSLLTPLEEIQTKKRADFKKLSSEVRADNLKTAQEEADKLAKTELINNTILDFSAKIAAATTDKEIVTIEKAMGTEKSRKGTYGDYLSDLSERMDELKPLIAAKKEAIRTLGGIEKEATIALNDGQDEKLEGLETQREEITSKVDELTVQIQEKAISGTRYYGGGYSKVVTTAPKPRRVTVEWEVEDMALFFKKHPDWVELMAKHNPIDEYVRGRKSEITETNPEIKVDGLRIFREEKY